LLSLFIIKYITLLINSFQFFKKGKVCRKLEVIDKEYHFEEGLIISSTDLSGIITYANRKFCEIAGYTTNELIDKNHNIIRHPDMLRATLIE